MDLLNQEKKSNILIVDDVSKNIQVLGSILRKEGYQIAYATNGKDALTIVENNKFDLILLDIMMPEMDGFEVCKILKSNSATKKIPVIFLTAKTEPESIINGFEIGGQDYVTKPFNSNELLARVRTHIDLKNKTEILLSINEILVEKVTEKTKELETANKQIKLLENIKGNFLNLLTNEIKLPLEQINSLLKDNDSTKEEQISNLKKSTDKLSKFSEMATLITQLKSETYKANFNLLSIIDVIDNIILDLKHKNINIEFKRPQEDLIKMFIDERIMKKCLYLLIESLAEETDKIDIHLYYDSKINLEISSDFKFPQEIVDKFSDFDKNIDVIGNCCLNVVVTKLMLDIHNGDLELINNQKTSTIKISLNS